MKPLVVIPARGGSKGIPEKNIKLLNGKPLIYYTIEAARAVFSDSVILVSTDDIQIKDVAEQTGLKLPFIRPSELATDTATTYNVLLHALQFSEENGYYPDTIILLQPTSPFRNDKHIKEAVELYESNLDMVVSVKETKSNPYYNLYEENDLGLLDKSKLGTFTRRQDCPKVWEYNGAIYIINVISLRNQSIESFTKVRKYVMNTYDSIDIDDPMDWILAETIISNKLIF
jgi:CMP-N,N'-diacetyllegionaminic acid synthase